VQVSAGGCSALVTLFSTFWYSMALLDSSLMVADVDV
jgi:hypothetical protein